VADFIFLHHGDGGDSTGHDWETYLAKLRSLARFEGGSGIGDGACFRKSGAAAAVTGHISGYIRVNAADMTDAASLLPGNPVYEAGGTVEIRELPKD
jgi:hypothetical protein